MRKFRPPSIRLLVTLVVFVPISVVSAALVIIATLTTRNIAERIGDQIVTNATIRVSREVQDYLGRAVQLSDAYVRRIASGQLPARGDLSPWRRPMLDDLVTNPAVASICIGNDAGDSTWLLRAHGRMELGYSWGARENQAIEYEIDASNRTRPEPLRVYKYDPRVRPWYKAALERSGGAVWTPVYFWFGESGVDTETGTGFTRVVYDGTGQPVGVLVIDVTLHALSDFLASLELPRSARVLLVDDEGLLVASSEGSVNSREGQRVSLAQSESSAARAVAAATQPAGAPSQWPARIQIDGQPARLSVTALHPYPGINWRIVTVLPEASFLAEAQNTYRRATMLAVIAIAGALLLGLGLSHRLSEPLLLLTRHVSRVGSGDLDHPLHLKAARELTVLSQELNHMASALKDRMHLQKSLEAARLVQQSLLPREVPAMPGLDVAARCEYCDSTGGDYHDFIPIPGAEGRMLIALGDVSGHGIAAAVLMAAARGGLRAATSGVTTSLGDAMTQLNRVITRDVGHGFFMTMVLMDVDPAAGTVRWANAGHDPVLVYHAAEDRFEELESGDVPLGIDRDVTYAEMSRNGVRARTVLVASTDGVWEARNADGEMFGKARLREIVRANADASADGIAERIRAAVAAFVADRPLKDDVTYVVVKPAR